MSDKITHKGKEFFTSGKHKFWCVTHFMCCGVRKYISIKKVIKPKSKSFIPDFKTGNMVPFKEICPLIEFERFVVFSTIKLKDEVNIFIREFLIVFHFTSAFVIVIESF